MRCFFDLHFGARCGSSILYSVCNPLTLRLGVCLRATSKDFCVKFSHLFSVALIEVLCKVYCTLWRKLTCLGVALRSYCSNFFHSIHYSLSLVLLEVANPVRYGGCTIEYNIYGLLPGSGMLVSGCASSLSPSVAAWAALRPSPWVLSTMTHGYRLHFSGVLS